MKRPIPIGVSDFRVLREQGMEYVDKSHLVREVLDKGAQAILLPRPRRFGKSLNLSMLRCFFEKRDEDLSGLFHDLSIWQAGDAYRAHFQRYPVVFLTFKDVKAERWDLAWEAIQRKIRALFEEHRYLLDSDRLSEWDVADLRAVLEGTGGPRRLREGAPRSVPMARAPPRPQGGGAHRRVRHADPRRLRRRLHAGGDPGSSAPS